MDKHSLNSATPEFSRVFSVDRLAEGEIAESIVAEEEERSALAKRFGLVALDSLQADMSLRQVGQGPVVRVEGRLSADVVQTCVVSLEPVANRIEERFVLHYAPERRGEPHGHIVDETVGEDDEDLPEPLVEGRIDIGEAVAQQLALGLDPYPRKPGIRLEDVMGEHEGVSIGEERASPFAVLARLKGRKS